MKQIINEKNQTFLSGHVVASEIVTDENVIRLHVHVGSASPQRFFDVHFKIFNPEWTYDEKQQKFQTNGQMPEFEIEKIEMLKLYPTNVMDIEGLTKDEIKAFCERCCPEMCDHVFSKLMM